MFIAPLIAHLVSSLWALGVKQIKLIIMGFFSWKTQDTNKSIPSSHSSKKARPVYLCDNRGNHWYEANYEGYGRFGGKDFYELLAEMNGKTKDDLSDGQEMRDLGIKLYFGISAIHNSKTNKTYKGGGIDFFNWEDDILEDGKGANQLLNSDDWSSITIKEKGIVNPNLVEKLDGWKYTDAAPEDCEYQGYFY